jgi:hypothetical protein
METARHVPNAAVPWTYICVCVYAVHLARVVYEDKMHRNITEETFGDLNWRRVFRDEMFRVLEGCAARTVVSRAKQDSTAPREGTARNTPALYSVVVHRKK